MMNTEQKAKQVATEEMTLAFDYMALWQEQFKKPFAEGNEEKVRLCARNIAHYAIIGESWREFTI